MTKKVLISRYEGREGLDSLDEVEAEIKKRLRGNGTHPIDEDCARARESLRNYTPVGRILDGKSLEETETIIYGYVDKLRRSK